MDTSLLDKAIVFAVKAHQGVERRGKDFPYIVHPMEAVSIAATMTGDQELLAAAALHDTVEDTDVTLDDIRREFGERVAKLVEEESDVFMEGVSEEASWHARKQASMERLSKASRDAKIVALSDKLSNARAIYRDFKEKGDAIWNIFHVKDVAEHEWHYRGLQRALHELAGTFAFTEFGQLVRDIFGEPKPERINMDDYEESGDGYTAISYNHKNGKTMMKLYAPFVPISEPHRELEVSWNLADKGLNIPHAHRLVTDGTRIGVEFERISPKKSFARAISQEPETLRRYAEEFARECKKLHAIPCDTKLFSPTENRFCAAITKLKEYSDEEKAKISAFIDSVPKATTCIHGDMHIGNIITNGEKNFWIDLSAFSYGNPLYDVGMLYFVSHTGDDELAQKLFHISAAQMLEVWTYFVPEYFGKEEPLASIDEKVKPFAALLMLMYYTWTGNPPAGMFELVKHSILEKF